jgi:hypothetical protein
VAVLFEAIARHLLSLVRGQERVIPEKELGIADVAGPGDPQMGFGLEGRFALHELSIL